MPLLGYILTALVGYLLGSIPTGFLVGRARGMDIRKVGSGNIGATNVFRQLGLGLGISVLLFDALKGWLAVVVVSGLVQRWLDPAALTLDREWLGILGGVTAILGHNYTCWLSFKGGKGIATSAGVLLALVPWALLVILTVWIVLFATTRYVSLASISASFVLPFATWFTGGSLTLVVITGALGALAIYKHKSNIHRLLSGTEPRIGPRKESVVTGSPRKS